MVVLIGLNTLISTDVSRATALPCTNMSSQNDARQFMSDHVSLSRKPLLVFVGLGIAMVTFMAAVFALGLRSTNGGAISPEQYATDFATLLPFGYAFSAGVVASVNPCGFLMLPAFVGYYMSNEHRAETGGIAARDLGKAVLFGCAVTAGFVVLFTGIGSIISAGGTAVVDGFPWAGLGIGLAMALLGVWLFATGRSIGFAWTSRISVPWVRPESRGIASAFAYGVAYGAASLSCTLPIFLVVVVTSLTRDGFLASMGQFLSFAFGMGLVVVAVALGATTLKAGVIQALRGIVPYVHRLSAILLVGSGLYLVVYWVVLGDLVG